MPTRKCIVCGHKASKGLFSFPPKKNEPLRQAWLEKCGVSDFKDHQYICSRHFKPTDFFPRRSETQILRLKLGVVPSENLTYTQSRIEDTTIKKKRIINRKCAIPFCSYFAPNGFHSFPRKDFWRKKWLKICGLKEEDVRKKSGICSSHFHSSHYIERDVFSQQMRLKMGAIPTQNLPKLKVNT